MQGRIKYLQALLWTIATIFLILTLGNDGEESLYFRLITISFAVPTIMLALLYSLSWKWLWLTELMGPVFLGSFAVSIVIINLQIDDTEITRKVDTMYNGEIVFFVLIYNGFLKVGYLGHLAVRIILYFSLKFYLHE